MNTYIALLRGINVGGRNRIKMKDLQEWFVALNFSKVQTYIQSGNVVFHSDKHDKEEVKNLIRKKIKEETDFDVPTSVLSSSEWQYIAAHNPVLNVNDYQGIDVSKLHITLLSKKPETSKIEWINSLEKKQMEVLLFTDNCIYLYCPNGYGKTKFNNTFLEKKLGVTSTTRNWKTTLKINQLLSEINN